MEQENLKLRAEVEQLQKEALIAWNNWGKENEVLKLQFEEARKIIEQVSYLPEFKKHFYDGSWQDPCGVHAFTEKYAEKRKCACGSQGPSYVCWGCREPKS
jgi:hypothetical protein